MDYIINKLSQMSLVEPTIKDDIDQLCTGFNMIKISDKPEVNKVLDEIKDTLEEEKPVQEIIKTVKNKFLEIGRILMQKERCFVPQVYSSPKWIF